MNKHISLAISFLLLVGCSGSPNDNHTDAVHPSSADGGDDGSDADENEASSSCASPGVYCGNDDRVCCAGLYCNEQMVCANPQEPTYPRCLPPYSQCRIPGPTWIIPCCFYQCSERNICEP
jgi:hypothetical protein